MAMWSISENLSNVSTLIIKSHQPTGKTPVIPMPVWSRKLRCSGRYIGIAITVEHFRGRVIALGNETPGLIFTFSPQRSLPMASLCITYIILAYEPLLPGSCLYNTHNSVILLANITSIFLKDNSIVCLKFVEMLPYSKTRLYQKNYILQSFAKTW